MRVIVVGAGEVGTHVAQLLSREGSDVTVIESDAARIAQIDKLLDVTIVQVNDDPYVIAGLANVTVVANELWTSTVFMGVSRYRSPVFFDIEDRRNLGLLAHFQQPGASPTDPLGVRLPVNRNGGDWISFDASQRRFEAVAEDVQVGNTYQIGTLAYDSVAEAAIIASGGLFYLFVRPEIRPKT